MYVAVAAFNPEAVSEIAPELKEPPAKVTVPVGLVPNPVTVAVIVTIWPKPAGFGEMISVVVLEACVPVPFRLMVSGFRALLAIETEPVRIPADCGVKESSSWQLCPAARTVEVVHVLPELL